MKAEDELEWIRIVDPIHIPKEYVEQIKDRDFTVDKFYQYQKMACLENQNGQVIINACNLLYVLVKSDKSVKGFCWMVVDPLSDALVINTFSMDNEYWGNGSCIKLLEKKAKEIQEGAGLKSVYWITRCPKHSEKYGFKRSKHVLMEYNHGKNTTGKSSETEGQSGLDGSGAETVS